MSRSLAEKVTFVVDSIVSLGINVRSGSRLDLMNRALLNNDGTGRHIKPDDTQWEVACEAIRDITQLEFFFDQVNLGSESKEIRLKVEHLIRDTVLPQDSSVQSPGRDVQAELFVFAACRKTSLNPTFEEPDIVCSLDHQTIAIAVKRIKNLRQLVKRIREGANQIQKAGGYGVIVVDVVIAINPKNYRVIAKVPDVEVGLTWRCLLGDVVKKYHDKIQDAVRDKGVLGVILHDHWVRMDSNGHWGLETMTYLIRAVKAGPPLANCFDAFTDIYRGAFPNMTSLTK